MFSSTLCGGSLSASRINELSPDPRRAVDELNRSRKNRDPEIVDEGQTLGRRGVLEKIGSCHGVNLLGETRNVGGERSKRVFIIVRSQKGPCYGHQPLRRYHFFRRRLSFTIANSQTFVIAFSFRDRHRNTNSNCRRYLDFVRQRCCFFSLFFLFGSFCPFSFLFPSPTNLVEKSTIKLEKYILFEHNNRTSKYSINLFLKKGKLQFKIMNFTFYFQILYQALVKTKVKIQFKILHLYFLIQQAHIQFSCFNIYYYFVLTYTIILIY